jgi:hypothetical protein|tara:strand:+ start:2356 stop:2823 length:468 start_codon:yes stop_codon:yes gene_type:complete
MEYEIQDNAYWEDGIDDRSVVKCIRMHKLPEGGKRKEVSTFSKTLQDRSLCPQYKEVVHQLGIEKIDANTDVRRKRKVMEVKTQKIKQDNHKKTQMLEKLFHMKLQAFEIPEIRDSKNKTLRTKLRRSQNEVEMNAYASLIIGLEAGVFGNDGTN